jgi:hypothetical protein
MEDQNDDDDEDGNIHTCDRCGKETIFSAPLNEKITERCLEDECIRQNIDLYV